MTRSDDFAYLFRALLIRPGRGATDLGDGVHTSMAFECTTSALSDRFRLAGGGRKTSLLSCLPFCLPLLLNKICGYHGVEKRLIGQRALHT